MTPPFWHLLRETEKYDECLMANDLRAEIWTRDSQIRSSWPLIRGFHLIIFQKFKSLYLKLLIYMLLCLLYYHA
jgi:hypothetical protein